MPRSGQPEARGAGSGARWPAVAPAGRVVVPPHAFVNGARRGRAPDLAYGGVLYLCSSTQSLEANGYSLRFRTDP